MARSLGQWGNDLHTGAITYPIVQKRRLWYIISGVLSLISLAYLGLNEINAGLDFKGGAEFVISDVNVVDTQPALDAIAPYTAGETPKVTIVGTDNVRVHMGDLTTAEVREIRDALADVYEVDAVENITSTVVGPTWGADVTSKSINALIWFLVLVTVVMSLYFRAWRMAAAALIALFHDLLFTVGVYAILGFEVTPASVIGFLTILGYSLYDTVVVFDKVRENTANLTSQTRYTYEELANLALNQTLVRSINTSVVALLPVTAILFIGTWLFSAGTFRDIALALFVGMAVGTYSSIFVATPIEVSLRKSEPKIVEHTAKVLKLRAEGKSDVVKADGKIAVGALKPGTHLGTKAQPKRKPRT